mmetsp:Transcript_34849/g.73309  ORF Transcript_34849/g.73309 Transcript_34849/m.73309 type:complete len:82 (+) Transcript_34849:180-425(+)
MLGRVFKALSESRNDNLTQVGLQYLSTTIEQETREHQCKAAGETPGVSLTWQSRRKTAWCMDDAVDLQRPNGGLKRQLALL